MRGCCLNAYKTPRESLKSSEVVSNRVGSKPALGKGEVQRG